MNVGCNNNFLKVYQYTNTFLFFYFFIVINMQDILSFAYYFINYKMH